MKAHYGHILNSSGLAADTNIDATNLVHTDCIPEPSFFEVRLVRVEDFEGNYLKVAKFSTVGSVVDTATAGVCGCETDGVE